MSRLDLDAVDEQTLSRLDLDAVDMQTWGWGGVRGGHVLSWTLLTCRDMGGVSPCVGKQQLRDARHG